MTPIVEVLPIKANIEAINRELYRIKKLHDPVWQGSEFGYNNFGGWSIQSRTGDYKEGWEMGIEKCTKNGIINYNLAKYLNISHPFEINQISEIFKYKYSSIVKTLNTIEQLGFYPRRARITVLKAGSKCIAHTDAPSDIYLHRIHIPLVTNEKCVHITEGTPFHMKADGSVYMIPVNVMHQIVNDSDRDRYHIIMDAYDTKNISKHYPYKGDINKLIADSIDYRANIESVHNGMMKNIMYSIAKKIYITKFKREQHNK
jgi:hypothetical protein